MKPDFTDKPFQNFHTEYTAVIPPENFNSAINSMPGFDPFLRGPYSTEIFRVFRVFRGLAYLSLYTALPV